MTISIIGAGAAGCFAAIEAARRMPQADICVYESLNRPLAKVAITGGGRCNLTNSFQEVRSLETVYPRGARLMKRLFHTFDHRDTMPGLRRRACRSRCRTTSACFPVRKTRRTSSARCCG